MTGRVALVVGGTGVIGGAVVERLRAEGAVAVAASRSGRAGLVLDARDDASVGAGISTLLEEHVRQVG
ncbi:hypothetical protein [Arthrobacter sp. UYEF21]|uniref:hypothetical protein n=1 Tax=Arthrobacter sp. UYEF21 TaxID=1756364 RepID=UPI003395E9AD